MVGARKTIDIHFKLCCEDCLEKSKLLGQENSKHNGDNIYLSTRLREERVY